MSSGISGLKALGGLLAVSFGAMSWFAFNDYAHQPVIKEVELVTQSAEMLENTLNLMEKQGNFYLTSENSTLPLTYALKKLEVVGQDNPDKLESIDKLITEIAAVKDSDETMADPLLYKAALLGLKTDLSEYAATNRDGGLAVVGGFAAVVSLLGIVIIIADYRIN
jgi:hypothetical protein